MHSITKKQREILLLLYRFRFLNRHHIQQLLNHKNDTRITAWLRDLTQKEYIGRIYSYKLLENTKPAIYYLTSKSKPLFKDENVSGKALQLLYKESKRSERFRTHWIHVADLYLFIKASAQGKEFDFYTKSMLLDTEYLLQPVPDAYIGIHAPTGDTKRYFVEVIDAGTPRFALKGRIKQYMEYLDWQEWEKATCKPFPTIMFICPTDEMQKYLVRQIPKMLEDNSSEFTAVLTTQDQLTKENIGTPIWQIVTAPGEN